MSRESPRVGFPWMAAVIGLGILASLYQIFWVAPSPWSGGARPDYLGIDYKIFYFHVSTAAGALILFFVCSLVSIGYLVLRRMRGMGALALRADRLCVAMAEVGVVFGLCVLISGPLWAKPAWGTYWTWEPRLTMALLCEFLFIGYLVLRSYGGSDEMGRVISAGVAVLGAPATYLTHVAVRLWGGNHPTVVTEGGGGLASPEMQVAFALSLTAIGLLVIYLVHGRYRFHTLAAAIDDLYLDLDDLEETP
ncbi:MAG: heme transporter [Deltaproteobacteria bacterium]|nr:heme transporter [Deltaproteobacteria bacterium]